MPAWGIITDSVSSLQLPLQERGSYLRIRLAHTLDLCHPNSLFSQFSIQQFSLCFPSRGILYVDPSIWVKRWPSVPNIKKATQCWSELSRRCTSWETGRCRFKLPALETFGISHTCPHLTLVQVDVLKSPCVLCANHQCVVTHGQWTWSMLNCVE